MPDDDFDDEFDLEGDDLSLHNDEGGLEDLDDPDYLDTLDEPDVTAFDDADDGGVAFGSAGERTPMSSWTAWEIGAAFGLGSWLLDRHAEQVAEHLHNALVDASVAALTVYGPRGAPHPPPYSGFHYEVITGDQHVGDRLDQAVLFSELVEADGFGQDLLIEAATEGPDDARLVVSISTLPTEVAPRLWAVLEERPQGFSATRLAPVFQPDQAGRLLLFASDYAQEVVDAVLWACQREGAELSDLVVSRKHAPR